MKLISLTIYFTFLLLWISVGATTDRCQVYYEWTLAKDTRINDTQYYAFRLDESTGVGTYTLPIYDTMELTGDPVAMLRGNMIASNNATDFTATATLSFFQSEGMDHLGVHVSYSYNPDDERLVYGYTVGGTGRFRNFQASAISVVVATEPEFIVEWTLCDERPWHGRWWMLWS